MSQRKAKSRPLVGLAESIRRETTLSRRDLFAAGLTIAAGFSAACQPGPAEQANLSVELALAKAARYLWAQQSEDGGWHSTTYGLLGSGQSLTPFVLDALVRVPTDVLVPPPEKLQRALAFIRSHTDGAGAVGRMDPLLPDYPNYSTALAVTALCRARPSGWEQDVAAMVEYLRGQQFSEANGWRPNDAPYGAWGMGGDRRVPPNPGHVDLSMTRHVLEALSAAGVAPSDPAFRKAAVYVERCHNFEPSRPDIQDGGFYFSTVVLDANKAGPDAEGYRSYGTATADGILALLAMSRSPAGKRVQAARSWLESHHLPDRATGFIGEAYKRWPAGLRFYYAACATKAFRKLAGIPHQEFVAAGHCARLSAVSTPLVSDARRPRYSLAGSMDAAVHSCENRLLMARGREPREESSPGVAPPAPVSRHLQTEQRPDGSWANPENLVKEDDPLIATPFAVRALLNEGAVQHRQTT